MTYLFTLYQNMNLFVGLIILLAFWSLIWKGFALWRAGQHKSVGWFIVLLIFNTAGILPILYLIFTKNPNKKVKKENTKAEDTKKKGTTEKKKELSETKTKQTKKKVVKKKVAKK